MSSEGVAHRSCSGILEKLLQSNKNASQRDVAVLLDDGAASALRWHADSLAMNGISIERVHELFAKCGDARRWRSALQALRNSSREPTHQQQLTFVATKFLWDYEKLLSDLVVAIASGRGQGDGDGDGDGDGGIDAAANDNNGSSNTNAGDKDAPLRGTVKLRVLSALTEQAHNCYEHADVVGAMDFLQFQANLQRVAESARENAGDSGAACLVTVEYVSLACIPVVTAHHVRTAAASAMSGATDDVEVVLAAWPGVADSNPVLAAHVVPPPPSSPLATSQQQQLPRRRRRRRRRHRRSKAPHGNARDDIDGGGHGEGGEAATNDVVTSEQVSMHVFGASDNDSVHDSDDAWNSDSDGDGDGDGNSGTMSESQSGSEDGGDRTTPGGARIELPRSALKSLSLIAHNLAAAVQSLNLDVDDNHVWVSLCYAGPTP